MAAFKVGAKVEGQFTEDDVWYAATIDAVTADGKYAVTYTEYGNSETIPEARIRHAPFAFNVGAKVEGQFTEDDTWYAATIDAVSGDGRSYTVTYTEYGNSETIPASRIKPLPSAPSTPAAPLPKYKVGDKVEGQFTEDDTWYAATIDAVNPDGQYAVTYTEYGNSEVIPEARIRPLSSSSSTTTTTSTPAAPLPKYKVGDKVEGQFTEDDTWYAATIDAVNPDGQYAVTYTEYGNSEVIPEARIRTATGAAPAPAPAATSAPETNGGSDDAWGSSSSATTNGFSSTSDGFSSSSQGFSSSAGDKVATTTLFVAGLSYNTDENSLQAAFSEFAGLDKVRIVKDRDTGKSKGFGYVEFYDVESAEKAFNEAAGKEIDGRTIRLDYSQPKGSGGGGYGGGSRPPREPRSGGFGGASSSFGGASSGGFGGASSSGGKAPSSSLFVGGLSYDTDENSLEAAFSEFGNIDKVRVMKDRETGKSKGFAYIDFFDVETAEKALKEANGREVDGRPIRLDFSQPKGSGGGGKGGFGGGSGSSFGGGSSSFGDSGSSFGSSSSSSFGSSTPAPAPQRPSAADEIVEAFDASVWLRNGRTVSVKTIKGEVTLEIARSFADDKKGKLLSHLH